MDRQSANGGLAEYYSEGETRIPTWLVIGDKQAIAQATGLSPSALDGGEADTDDARIWLDDGQALTASPDEGSPKRVCTALISPSPRPRASR